MADLKDRYEITDRRLAAQFAVTRALAESSTLSEATPKLLQYVCEAVGFELGELWCVNAESNTLHVEGSWHLPAVGVATSTPATNSFSDGPASISARLLRTRCSRSSR